MADPERQTRAHYRHFLAIPTRWMDNDAYGHVNNVVYLRWVQDVATAHWRAAATADQQARYAWVAHRHEIDYKAPLVFRPEPVPIDVWVSRLGNSSFELRYEILDSKGKLFTNGPAYADAGAPDRGRWQVEGELPIGSYTVVAFVLSPKDGKRIASDRVKFRAG